MPTERILIVLIILAAVFFAVAVAVLLPAEKSGNAGIGAAAPPGTICDELILTAFKSKVFVRGGAGKNSAAIRSTLKKGFAVLRRKAAAQPLFDAEKWLYDNYYILLRAEKGVRNNRFYLLPHANGEPRIYTVAAKIVSMSECRYDAAHFKKYIDAFQSECTLTYAEVAALKTMTDFVLLEYAAELMRRILFCGKMIGLAGRVGTDDKTFAEYTKYNSFCYGMNERLQGKENPLAAYLHKTGRELKEKLDNFCRQQARYAGLAAACVTAIKESASVFTEKNLLSMQKMNAVFLKEEAGVYARTDDGSKSEYLRRAADLAAAHRSDETEFAAKVLLKANLGHVHVGSLLFDRKNHAVREAFYLTLSFASALILAAIFSVLFPAVWQKILFGALIFPQSYFFIKPFVIRLFLSFTDRNFFPALDFSRGVPEEARTLVAVSVMLGSKEGAERAVENLLVLRYANVRQNIDFALIADLPESKENGLSDSDNAVADTLKTLIKKYPDLKIFLRGRSESGGVFRGWERKRGALIRLMQYLEGDTGGFILSPVVKAGAYKYLVALDQDTFCGGIAELVGIISHPVNSRYVMIAPQISSEIENGMTAFQRGRADFPTSYSFGSGGAGNDLFNKGNFMGKGVIDIKRFLSAAADFFPENRILSHDFIEGALTGAANCRVRGLETFPKNYKSFFLRQLRWIRGDWQLLPYILPRVRNGKGKLIKNPVSIYDRSRIFDNMLLSLLPVSMVLLLSASLFAGGNLVLAAAGAAFLPFYGVLESFGIGIKALFCRQSLRASAKDRLKSVFSFLYYIGSVPAMAFANVKAVALTLFRLAVTKKNLLEWNTFASSNRAGGESGFYLRINILPLLLCAALAAAAAFMRVSYIPYAVLGSLIVLSVIISVCGGRKKPERELKGGHKDLLESAAKRMWAYFSDTHKPEYNYLPCDNYQEHNGLGFAPRTSPTNIGFGFAGAVCALDYGFISAAEAEDYIGRMLSSAEKLKKFEGNLFNWYDVRSLEPLSPAYVSSVDSGNFLACLLLTKIFLEKKGIGKALLPRLDALIDNTHIESLFDDEKGLFFVGLDYERGKATDSHYDLLASEALLTYIVSAALGKIGAGAIDRLSAAHVKYGGKAMLYSWTGGCFEYLMPLLFLDIPLNTLYGKSAYNASRAQIVFSAKRGLPAFGVSESQYYLTDNNGHYQYKAFGVDGAALRQGRAANVVSPYSSFLMLKTVPERAAANIAYLWKHSGKYGLVEAFDYDSGQEIRSFMAHHTGMSLLALSGILGSGLPPLFSGDPRIAGALKKLNVLPPSERTAVKRVIKESKPQNKGTYSEIVTKRHDIPYLNVLSSPKYSVVTTEGGGGYSIAGDCLITAFGGRAEEGGYAVYSGEKNILDGKCGFFEGFTRYTSSDGGVDYCTEVFLLPALCGELRSVTVTNRTEETKILQIRSMVTPCLCPQNEYIAHPAYSRLFIDAGYDVRSGCLTAFRTNKKEPLYLAHYLAGGDFEYETSRYKLTRGRFSVPEKTQLNLPDKVLCIKKKIILPPKGSQTLDFLLFAAKSKEKLARAAALASSFGYTKAAESSFLPALDSGGHKKARDIIVKTLFDRSQNPQLTKEDIDAVAALGVNVNSPVLTYDFSAGNTEGFLEAMRLLAEIIPAMLPFQLAVIYREANGYYTPLYDRVREILAETGVSGRLKQGSFAFIVNETHSDKMLCPALRKISDCELSGEIFVQRKTVAPKSVRLPKAAAACECGGAGADGELPLGIGVLEEDGTFCMSLDGGDAPMPYSNIAAWENAGMLATETGGGYTYSGNSRERKLTDWSNDPCTDRPSEWITLRERGRAWSVSKYPEPAADGSIYSVRHCRGYSVFLCEAHGLNTECAVFVHPESGVKYYRLRLTDTAGEHRKVDAALSLNLVLGDFQPFNFKFFRGLKEGNTLKVCNIKNSIILSLTSSEEIGEYSFSLSGSKTDGVRASAEVRLAPRGSAEIYFAFSAKSFEFSAAGAQKAFDAVREFFMDFQSVTLQSPDDRLNSLYNYSLLNQVLSSRFYARAGYYQAGGAIGFRDQLQDCLALLYHNPQIVRKHILTCCAHQFAEGDVMHWWHPEMLGVRTGISDDKLFLPLVTAEYIGFTGDTSILRESVPYCEGLKLPAGSCSAFGEARASKTYGSVYEHCVKAVENVDFGINGLCLMGSGDWNDAMDEVGKGGKGESVFLSMFYCYVLSQFSKVADSDAALSFARRIQEVKNAVADSGFESGGWYLRAFFDDGTPLGGKESPECSIDLLCQAWASLSGIDAKRAQAAVKSAYNRLVDTENRLIKLLDPPFTKAGKRAGYISDYPEGIRENGGQYTHAAVWFIMALFKEGMADEAVKMLDMINPLSICRDFEGAARYMVEPYVLAGDVYSGEGKAGAGGWSWYTGSAAWYFKCVTESLLGLEKRGARLYIAPKLPSFWKKCGFSYSSCGISFRADIVREGGQKRILIDNVAFNADYIELDASLNGKKITVFV